jgi:hypothetical protein
MDGRTDQQTTQSYNDREFLHFRPPWSAYVKDALTLTSSDLAASLQARVFP